jgi:hypothetical protein
LKQVAVMPAIVTEQTSRMCSNLRQDHFLDFNAACTCARRRLV